MKIRLIPCRRDGFSLQQDEVSEDRVEVPTAPEDGGGGDVYDVRFKKDERRCMDQETRWLTRYNEVKTFIESNHRNPSKYDPRYC